MLVSVYAVYYIIHIVADKGQSMCRAREVKVLLTTTVRLGTLVLIYLSSAQICLTCTYMHLDVGSFKILTRKVAVKHHDIIHSQIGGTSS
jgi:hypothetical protein